MQTRTVRPVEPAPPRGGVASDLARVLSGARAVVLGKDAVLRLALTCLLARGHLLIEDVPGVGKTTLAHTLAQLLGLSYQRIQFTSDLLPADILGASVLDPATRAFRFHPGPVFAQLVLCDEVNRATPKTQSALLEAMEERQVTHDGATYPLPSPFFVVATQNPERQIGTYPLPESQLDRFLMRLTLGYPDRDAERDLLRGEDRRQVLAALEPAMGAEAFMSAQAAAERVHVSEALIDYVQALLHHSRISPELALGLSPRAGLGILQAARAWALIDDRGHVLPEDVQAVLGPVAGHRLTRRDGQHAGEALVEEIVLAVPVP